MSTWRSVLLAALAVSVVAIASHPAAASAQVPQYVASDSYYRLDPSAGTMTVRVEATIQNAGSQDVSSVLLWAMPKAWDVVVAKDDAALTTKIDTLPDETGISVVLATLPRPMKPGARVDVVMSYAVPAQAGTWVRLEPGVIETPFVSQGEGSFVFIDVPTQAENYFDPGCLRAADQPRDIKEAGFERWVCGDATLIALATDDQSVQARCAQADDKCRQRLSDSPYSAFAQSISDPSTRGTKEADVVFGGKTVKLTLRYFRKDAKWADEQFATAVEAVPKLQELFGFPYDHPTMLMRQSHHIEMIGAAGVAFPAAGEVLLASDTGFDREVTIHELAHQWAGENLSTNWLWEGLAEYAMRVVAPTLGVKPIDRKWESFGYKDPLATWHNGSAVRNPNYWYGKSGAFWFAFEKAVGGPENMKAVLARMADDPRRLPLDGRWFMDRGEEVSGANLDSLFLDWVFNADTATAMLKDRREARELVKGLSARAAELGLSGLPADLSQNLDAWVFGGVGDQVARASKVLEAYAAVLGLASASDLPPTDAVAKAWKTGTVAAVAGVVENQRQALVAITETSRQLASEPGGSPALPKLAGAREKYAAGDFDGAERLASLAITVAADQATAAKMIELAKQKQASFAPNFLGQVGMFFTNPGDELSQAESAYAAGDPSKALKLARSAYDGWNGADSRGVQRLAIFAGLMATLCAGVWWLLQRFDPGAPAPTRPRHPRPGDRRKADDRPPEKPATSWRDWENLP